MGRGGAAAALPATTTKLLLLLLLPMHIYMCVCMYVYTTAVLCGVCLCCAETTQIISNCHVVVEQNISNNTQ